MIGMLSGAGIVLGCLLPLQAGLTWAEKARQAAVPPSDYSDLHRSSSFPARVEKVAMPSWLILCSYNPITWGATSPFAGDQPTGEGKGAWLEKAIAFKIPPTRRSSLALPFDCLRDRASGRDG